MNTENDKTKPAPPPYRWALLAIVWLALFIGSYAQAQFPPLAYKIIPALGLTPSQFASVYTAPMLPAVFLGIIAGNLADRFGVKRIASLGLALATIGIFARAAAKSFWQMFPLMALSGCGSAFLSPNLAKLLGAWFPPEELTKAMGIATSSLWLAVGLATATTAMFPTISSAFITAGVGSVIILVLWLVFAKERSAGTPETPSMPVLQYLKVAARSRNVWLLGIGMLPLMGGMTAFGTFFPEVLRSVKGFDPVAAGALASMGTVGSVVGTLVGPLIADRIGYYKPFLFVGSTIAALITLCVWYVPSASLLSLLLILSGASGGATGPIMGSYPMLLPEIGFTYAGSAGGIIMTMQLMGSVFVAPYVITPLVGTNYFLLFVVSAACSMFAAFIILFLPEVGTKARRKPAVTAAPPAD